MLGNSESLGRARNDRGPPHVRHDYQLQYLSSNEIDSTEVRERRRMCRRWVALFPRADVRLRTYQRPLLGRHESPFRVESSLRDSGDHLVTAASGSANSSKWFEAVDLHECEDLEGHHPVQGDGHCGVPIGLSIHGCNR
jgi:hypothetical protein